MIRYHIRRFIPAFRGIWYALRHDRGFKLEGYGGALFLCGSLYLLQPFTATEFLWLTLGWCLILITELQNSALELTLDHLHPEQHEMVGRSKDLTAAAVLLAAGFLGIVVLVLTAPRLLLLL